MSESDISTSVKNGILYLEDPFDQVSLIQLFSCFGVLLELADTVLIGVWKSIRLYSFPTVLPASHVA